MIDTVTLWLDTLEGVEAATEALTGQRETIDRQTGEVTVRGRLKNLSVRIGGQGLSVTGSLARFHYGSNSQSLTRRAIEEAIEGLSDRLHLPMEQARVYRLDIAGDLIMRKPVIEYLPQLVSAPYLKRSEFADRQTVLFSNRQKAQCLYDKRQEIESKHEPVPEVFTGRNVLRYENRVLKRLAVQFHREEVRGADLIHEAFYMEALKKWEREYFNINKLKRGQVINMKNVKELEKSLASYGLQVIGGEARAMDLIRSAREQGQISKMQCQRLKEKIRELSIAKGRGEESDDIAELDEKVKQAVACYR